MIKIVDDQNEVEKAYSYLKEKFPEVSKLQRDPLKSLDYKTAIELAEKNLDRDSFILNCGASNDPSLWYLSELGYKHLYGMDLDKNITDMPYYWRIKYMYGSMVDTHLPSNMFDALISISTIEHGNGMEQAKAFLREAKRVLKDGGILMFSTDYSEGHIDTRGDTKYGVGWHIFDRQEVKSIIGYAKSIGFGLYAKSGFPEQRTALVYNKRLKKGFSFILLAFVLKKPAKLKKIKEVNILYPYLDKVDGLSKYSYALAEKFRQVGVKPHLYKSEEKIKNKHLPTVAPYDDTVFKSLPKNKNTVMETFSYPANKKVIFNNIFRIIGPGSALWRDPVGSVRRFKKAEKDMSALEEYPLLVYNNEFGGAYFKKYTIMPHIAYPKMRYKKKGKAGLCLGAFGFAFRIKHFDKICELAKRLGVKAVLVVSATNVNEKAKKESLEVMEELKRYESAKIRIVDSYDDARTLSELSACTHIIFAQDDARNISGSMRFCMQLGVPVVSTDTYQAREAQTHRVKSLDEITIDYLKKTKEPTRLDDGFTYLLRFLESGYA
ncbi:MAG: class I SAM-dependent methyltransferase [Candidatus Micrarchaeota archaeon]|nr:class I SAM-dependent methyltransferase [Candidatus Micrarchaeota archaeon]